MRPDRDRPGFRPYARLPAASFRGAAGRQGGFSIIMAIFLVVVLSLLGGFIVNVTTMRDAGSTLDIMGSQAYQTANAGIEWGLSKAQSGACAGTSSFAVGGMTVTVTCSKTTIDEDGATSAAIYALTATACNLGASACPGDPSNPLYVERRLDVTAEF